MSTTWTSIQVVSQPIYTQVPDVPTLWQVFPTLTGVSGFGFGQGGFGQGGFGGGSSQPGTSQPVWTAWTVD